jgi:hypothetical protein
VKHYAALADKAVANSHVVDIFACSLDQVCRSKREGIDWEKML